MDRTSGRLHGARREGAVHRPAPTWSLPGHAPSELDGYHGATASVRRQQGLNCRRALPILRPSQRGVLVASRPAGCGRWVEGDHVLREAEYQVEQMRAWVLNPPFLPKYSRAQRSPAVTKSGTIYFPIWLAGCVGVLEEAGHEVTFTDAPAQELDRDRVLSLAREQHPRLIVMDTSTPSIAGDISVAEQLKAALPDSFLVLVGTHVSALPEETLLASTAVDAIARGEYEYVVRDLADLLADSEPDRLDRDRLGEIAGLSFRVGDAVVHNADRPLITDLDELPWVSKVYRKHLEVRNYFNPNALYPMVTLVSSRGCPFRCSFCVYPQTMYGHTYRFRDIEDVVDEMAYIVREFPGVKSIFFEDDTLTANKKRCLAFADAIVQRGLKIPWTANSRIELDADTLRRLQEACCRELCVGFESGSQDTLNAMHKGTKVEQMFRFMDDARQAGILIHGCFMIGFPGETREAALQTLELAVQLAPDTAQFYPVMVYPGTEAYAEYKQRGWLTAESYRDWLTPDGLHNCVVRNEHLSSQELVRLCDLGRRRFYLRPRYIAYKLKQLIRRPGEIVRTAKAARVFCKHLMLGSRV